MKNYNKGEFNKEVDMFQGISGANDKAFGSSAEQEKSKDIVGKNEFLKLLTFQLREQNPLNPYNNQEFAAQLAQFSQLEQMIDIRSLMEEQVAANKILSETISNTALSGMLGKYAKAYSSKIEYNGVDPVKIGYNLNSNAAKGNLTIKDEFGNIVRNFELTGTQLSSGEHKLDWDGQMNNGDIAQAGKYTFEVQGYDASGNKFSADNFAYGRIDAVRFKSDGTYLVVGGMEVPLNAITDITAS